MGLTALDLLDHQPKDFKTLEIRELLIKGGVMRTASHEDIDKKPMISTSATQATALLDATWASAGPKKSSILKSWLRKLVRYLDSHQEYWVEESRGSLMVVATVIATISFQVIVIPPGGFWHGEYRDTNHCNSTDACSIGTPVFGDTQEHEFVIFTIVNSISFLASLSVILLVLGGFPIRKRIIVWLLTLAMGTAVTSMLLTYLLILDMLTSASDKFNILELVGKSSLYWIALVIVVGGVHIMRLICLTVKGIHKLLHPLLMRKMNAAREVQEGYPGLVDNPDV